MYTGSTGSRRPPFFKPSWRRRQQQQLKPASGEVAAASLSFCKQASAHGSSKAQGKLVATAAASL